MELAGSYGDYWEGRDYSQSTVKVPLLIVQGLNDYNVETKHADLMAKAGVRSGVTTKLVLHQNLHTLPGTGFRDIMIGDEFYTNT